LFGVWVALALWVGGRPGWMPRASAANPPSAGASELDGKTVSVSLEAADLRAVVTALARAHNINLVGSDKLAGKVTLNLNNAPVREALEIILKNAGFVLVRKETGIYEIMTEAQSAQIEGATTLRVFRIKYADVATVATLLVPNAIPNATSIAQDPASGQLVIRGSEEELLKAEQIIQAIDRPVPQVAIEARIVEIFADRAKSLGVSVTLRMRSGDLGDDGTGIFGIDLDQDPVAASTLDFAYVSDRIDAALNALAQKDVAEVLSAPRVTTGHGRPAEIRITNQVPVITRTTRVVDQVTVTDETVTFKETGLTLTVTPRVLADHQIQMVVEPSVLELTGWTDTDPPAPIIDTRSAKTDVTIHDGKWLVIGGLMRYNEQKIERGVPLLKDIPVLGWLFKTTDTKREKSNLIILVSATVLDRADVDAEAKDVEDEVRDHRKTWGLEGGPFPPPEAEGATEAAAPAPRAPVEPGHIEEAAPGPAEGTPLPAQKKAVPEATPAESDPPPAPGRPEEETHAEIRL